MGADAKFRELSGPNGNTRNRCHLPTALRLRRDGGRDILPTVPSVDLARYAGAWYEIARLPMWFQRHCVSSKAVYTLRPDGAVGVHNECVTDRGGVDQAEGVATVVDTATNARLTVVFNNFFARLFGSSREGNYWILALDRIPCGHGGHAGPTLSVDSLPYSTLGGGHLSTPGRAGSTSRLSCIGTHSCPTALAPYLLHPAAGPNSQPPEPPTVGVSSSHIRIRSSRPRESQAPEYPSPSGSPHTHAQPPPTRQD